MNRREEMEFELRQLDRLESQLTNKSKILDDIKAVKAKLEAEKTALLLNEE